MATAWAWKVLNTDPKGPRYPHGFCTTKVVQKWDINPTSLNTRLIFQCHKINVIWAFCMMWLFCYANKWHPYHKSWYTWFAVQNMIHRFCLQAAVVLCCFHNQVCLFGEERSTLWTLHMLQGLALLPSANWHNCRATPIRLQLMHGSGLTPNVAATDLESVFITAQSLRIHTLLLQLANRVAILWALAKSEVHCLLLGSGEQPTGGLRSALQWVLHKQDWLEIRCILKVWHTTLYDATYEELLWITLHKLPDTYMYTNLFVDSLWQCWLISKHQLGIHIHKQNVEQLMQVL